MINQVLKSTTTTASVIQSKQVNSMSPKQEEKEKESSVTEKENKLSKLIDDLINDQEN